MSKSSQISKESPEFIPKRKERHAPKIPLSWYVIGSFVITFLLGGVVVYASIHQDTSTPTPVVSKTNTMPINSVIQPSQNHQIGEIAKRMPSEQIEQTEQKQSRPQVDITHLETGKETSKIQYQTKKVKNNSNSSPMHTKPEMKQRSSKQTNQPTQSQVSQKQSTTQKNNVKPSQHYQKDHQVHKPSSRSDQKHHDQDKIPEQNNPSPNQTPSNQLGLKSILQNLKVDQKVKKVEATISRILPHKDNLHQ